MAPRRSAFRILWLLLAGLAALAILFRVLLLTALGSYLVTDSLPEKADLALVLGGGADGSRILKAGELARRGYVPKVLVSGPGMIYGYHECDLEIPYAVKKGYPESYFLHLENDAHSTAEEARAVVPELRRLGARRILLVTSDYHTHRAGDVFRKAAPDLTFQVIAAPDRYFSAGGWWRNREGQKIFLLEWMKTVANWFGV